jgi:uncharacterized protein DUF929
MAHVLARILRLAGAAVLIAGLVAGGGTWQTSATAAGAPPVRSIGGFTRVATPSVSPDQPVSVFFLSALYCPFCAAERWALADALGRFGTWADLGPSHSTGGVDGIPEIPTYDFVHARYTSRFVQFQARDIADEHGNARQALRPAEQALVNRFDPEGSIPFLLIAGGFAQLGSGFSPGLLVGKPFVQVRADLAGDSPDGRAIRHEADVLAALICVAHRGIPQTVCAAPAVRGLETQVR